MGWTQMSADDIGTNLSVQQLDLIYDNFAYLRDKLLEQTQREASIVKPDTSLGQNTPLNKVQDIINNMETILTSVNNTAGWVNPYYDKHITWEKLTQQRREKVVRWIKWANFLYDEICAEHDGFDYLRDINNDIICDINNVPIVCFV